jgi:muconolactone delta-isomerase
MSKSQDKKERKRREQEEQALARLEAKRKSIEQYIEKLTKIKLLKERNTITISMSPFAAENYKEKIETLCKLPAFTHVDTAIKVAYDKAHQDATPEKFKIFESLALQDDVEILV